MTVEQLESIISCIKQQIDYELEITYAFNKIFSDSDDAFIDTPLWAGFCKLLDAALGLEDFFDWWIWDTQCGEKCAVKKEQDGTVIYVRNAEEIIKYAESLNKKIMEE